MRTIWVVCPECDGQGGWLLGIYDGIDCDTCLGSGRIKQEHSDGDWIMTTKEKEE